MSVLDKIDVSYKNGYDKIVELLGENPKESVCDDIVSYIRNYTPQNGAEVDVIHFIDYVADNLYMGDGMSIFDRGHKCIGNGRGVLFERLKMLKNELQRTIQSQTASTPQIDCIMTDEEISRWLDRWSVGRFGEDCLNPARYYKTTKDGRYLYGVKEGATNEEKAIRERVLELLCKIISINKKLNGEGLTKHLTYNEREAKKNEREKLYKEFLSLTQPQPEQKITKPTRGRGRPKETLKDKMIDDADGKKLQRLHEIWGGKKGKDAALIILVCLLTGWMNTPTYTQVKDEFGDIGSKAGFNKYLKKTMFTDEEIEGAKAALNKQ